MPQRFIDINLSSLVPDSLSWANGNVDHWIRAVGNFEHMIGYAGLFWPDFIEHDGCILVARVSEENYQTWLIHFDGNKQAVESVVNHTDLAYLFNGNPNLDPTDDQLTYLGRLLQEMWQAKLARQFPGRRLVVDFSDDPDDQPMITVYQDRDPDGQVKN